MRKELRDAVARAERLLARDLDARDMLGLLLALQPPPDQQNPLGQSARQIRDALHIDAGTCASTLKRLQDAGLVQCRAPRPIFGGPQVVYFEPAPLARHVRR